MSKPFLIGAAGVVALAAVAALPQMSTAAATGSASAPPAVFQADADGYRTCFVKHRVVFKTDGPARQAVTTCVTDR
ncbi:hypothetical protein [Bosea sp. 117]|uniref:hypothetical protein n=1 Tax=Bosea sp. 117 TaxID=1125973 RepID=UPI000493B6BD|nr:hypothetical protein [Bosea sp. 117]